MAGVTALCPSPEGATATGRERGLTEGDEVRFCWSRSLGEGASGACPPGMAHPGSVAITI